MAARTISAHRLVPQLGSATQAAPAYLGVAEGLRLLIEDGRIPVGVRLPSERELSLALGVSRTTIARAYDTLRENGHLHSRQGSGSVAALPGAPPPLRGRALELVSTTGDLRADPGDDVLDLTCAAMPAPVSTLAGYQRAVQRLPSYLGGTGYHPMGLTELRQLLAQRYTDRGVDTSADQIMITGGAVAALAVSTRALLGPGDRVLVEHPSYPNAIETLRRGGARIVALPMLPDGWDLPGAAATLRQSAPRAAYLIPDFHNPTGALLDDPGRAALGRELAATRTVALIDETLVDLAHDEHGRRPLPFAAHHEATITLGSASKTFWGGFRVGWLRAPSDQMAALMRARLTLDLGAPVLEQLALAELLRDHDAVLAERRTQITVARDTLVSALRERLPQWQFDVPAGGLNLWVRLPAPLCTPLVAAADRRGLVLAPGVQFAVEGTLEDRLRLPFTGLAPERYPEVVDRLALAWQDVAGSRRTPSPVIL